MAEQMKKERARRLFLIAFVLFTFANGFGGSIISNYFKGVYQVDSVQRGLLDYDIQFQLRMLGEIFQQ